MRAVIVFQCRTPEIAARRGDYTYLAIGQYFRLVEIECATLTVGLDLVREHELPSDNFVNVCPIYGRPE
jgi:hypothetical protein